MITINSGFGYEVPIKDCYHLIKQAGFDGVFIMWSDVFGDLDFRKYPEYARSEGLYVTDIHTPFNGANYIWLDNLDGQAITENLLRCVNDCAAYDIQTMIVHLTGGVAGGIEPPVANEIGLSRIKRIVEHAEQKNINIALENLRKLDHLSYLFKHIESNRLGFCYDSGHHHCRNPHDNILSLFGSRMMALHLHDNDGSDDQHRMPFDSTIDWSDTMKKITKTSFTGATALEIMNWGYDHLADKPEEFLKIAYERAKKLEAMRND